jgi:hypothetical protein
VNVLDPYIPGSSGLFTVDFWRLARDHLEPGGVYSQLFWGPDIALLFMGLTRVFPHVLAYPSGYAGSYNVVASMEPFERDLHLERLEAPVLEAMQKFGIEDEEQAREYFEKARRRTAIARRRISRLVSEAGGRTLHTDDHPVLEYRWANKFDRVSIFDSHQAYDWE